MHRRYEKESGPAPPTPAGPEASTFPGRRHRIAFGMDNRGIASLLGDIAVFSELVGENPFKARAFQSVARSVEKHPERSPSCAPRDA